MNLLIVEDELRLRSGLANNISWESHHIEIVGLAADGLEALKLVEMKKPDIILLDIQIPGINGIEFAKRVKAENKEIQIIILSGHDNFFYAQTALELGVFKYLLKPAGEDEILNAVIQAAEAIKQNFKQKLAALELDQKWKEYLPRLQESYFLHLVHGNENTVNKYEKFEQLQIKINPAYRFTVALIDIDSTNESVDEVMSAQDISLAQFKLFNVTKEILQEDGVAHWCFQDTNGSTIVLFVMSSEIEPKIMLEYHQLLNKVLTSFHHHIGMTASAGVCSSCGELEDLNRLYRQAQTAIKERIIYGHNLVIPYAEHSMQNNYYVFETHLEKDLEIALETGDKVESEHILKRMWQSTLANSQSSEVIQEFVLYVSGFFIRLIHKQNWNVKEVMGSDYVFLNNLSHLSSIKQIEKWLGQACELYVNFLLEQKKTISHSAVKEILDLIEKEMHEDITLQIVADKLYINSSYLSRLFKKETGKSFSSYVIERKMETAKKLLQKGHKVYDAANMTGFKDPSYFTKVFRKYWGITPVEIQK